VHVEVLFLAGPRNLSCPEVVPDSLLSVGLKQTDPLVLAGVGYTDDRPQSSRHLSLRWRCLYAALFYGVPSVCWLG